MAEPRLSKGALGCGRVGGEGLAPVVPGWGMDAAERRYSHVTVWAE